MSLSSQSQDNVPVSLYRRFRPTRFSSLVGQDSAVRVLTNAVKTNKPSHAYLFYGPRGTGKTTAARLLAKALNCEDQQGAEPCGFCASCTLVDAGGSLDIVELDAASNNGVDRIREINSSTFIAPHGRYRVFILDEAHMLSPSASNALLKTLEEPPPHVVFILATTSPQSLLDTVVSRTQRLSFRLVDPETLTGFLTEVSSKAALDVSSDVISQAVRSSKGSPRDALSALDALSLGADSEQSHAPALVEAVLSSDVAASLCAIAEAVKAGVAPLSLAQDVLDELREVFLIQMGATELLSSSQSVKREELAKSSGPRRTVRAMDHIGDALECVRLGHDARIALEVAACRAARMDVEANLASRVQALESSQVKSG